MVIEIPAGTNEKWQTDTDSGSLYFEQVYGYPRLSSMLWNSEDNDMSKDKSTKKDANKKHAKGLKEKKIEKNLKKAASKDRH